MGFGDYRNAVQEHEDGRGRETTLLGLRFTAVDIDRAFRRRFAHSLIRFFFVDYSIKRLDITVSDELYLTFDADGPYTNHIFGWTRALRMRQMRQLKGKDGEPLYVYQMPGSVAELVGSPSTP